jgi:Chromosome segregation ATPases
MNIYTSFIRKSSKKRRNELLEQRKRLEERLAVVRDRIRKIKEDPRIEAVRKKIEEIEVKRNTFFRLLENERKQEVELLGKLTPLEGRYRIKKADLEDLKKKRDEMRAELSKLESVLATAEDRIKKLEDEIRELRKKLDEAKRDKKEVEKIIGWREYVIRFAVCPCCGAPIDRERILEDIDWYRRRWAELNETIRSIEQEISEKTIEINELKDVEEKVSKLRKSIDEISGEIEQLEKEIKEIESDIEKRNSHLRRLESG